MSLQLIVTCSNHRKNDGLAWGKEIQLWIEGPKQLDPQNLKERIEQNAGWVVQFNGDNMDTYCSKKCAE